MWVLDASVLLKWFLRPDDEPLWNVAEDLHCRFCDGRLGLLDCPLALYEIGNTLTRLKPEEDARQDLADYLGLAIPTAAFDAPVAARAATLVRNYGVTFYDAAYHALAQHHGATLVTADNKYLDRAAAAGNICHLRDWKAA